MAGRAAPGGLYGEVSAGWTPDAPVALVLFHGYGANEQDLAPLGPMLAPALPWAALRAPLEVAPGGYAWVPPVTPGDRDPARATDAAWQWIDAHLTRTRRWPPSDSPRAASWRPSCCGPVPSG
jgi:phospholipase/carboxylesterase